MKQWQCEICGFVYSEKKGLLYDNIAPGTVFENIPSDWVCPNCQVGKEDFSCLQEIDA